MKKTTILYATAAALFCATACTQLDDAETKPADVTSGGQNAGSGVTALLPLKVASLERFTENGIPLTRAPLESEGMDTESISNIWVFQFGEADTDDERLLVSPPYYIDGDTIQEAIDDWTDKGGTSYSQYPHIPIPLIESAPGEVHLVAFAANINSKDFYWGMSAVEGQKSSYAELKNNVFLLDGEGRSYGGDQKNLLMSGRVYSAVTPEIILDDKPDDPAAGGNNDEEGIPLCRSLARIELDLSVDPGVDFKVLSVQLRNVPQSIDIFDALVARDENLFTDYTLVYPELPAEFIDYDIISNTTNKADGLISTGESSKYQWYVPRNMRGQSYSNSAKTKNKFAPAGATYIEVVAVNTAQNNKGVIYRIYPGLDDINDHTILANHEYNVALNIKGSDGELQNDSSVEQYSTVRFDGNNNSFILNPPLSDGMGPRRFEIPVTQVNRYWRQMWNGYGGLGENILKSDTEWQVDLLWQDDTDMVRATADTDTRIWISKSEGTGSDSDGYFSITVPYDAVNGNFSVALRRKESGNVVDEVLWSWHFWVTGYNPDEHKMQVIQGHKFAYPVSGGQVHRYGGSVWGYDTVDETTEAAVANNWHNYTYNESSTAFYAKAFIMDRNLGAVSDGYISSTSKGNITYQWGRKDPFPPDIKLYDINGSALGAAATAGFDAQKWNGYTANALASDTYVKMSQSVSDPMRFYYAYYTNRWTLEVDGYAPSNGNGYVWHDPLIPTGASASVTSYEGKSIYDPCPPGWKLPVRTTWNDFRRNNTSGWTTNNGSHNRGDGFGAFDNGIRYWPNILTEDGEYPVDGVIFFPASGFRRSYSSSYVGRYRYDGTYGYNWIAVPASSSYGYNFYYDSSGVSETNAMRCYGYAVRCVSMDE